MTQSARAQSSDLDSKCYTKDQMHSLAKEETRCAECELDLKVMTDAYTEQVDSTKAWQKWYQDPAIEIAGVTIAFGLGTLFAATKCIGLCK